MNPAASSPSADPRIAAYLDALGRALYGLPEPSRSEVYDEIRQHIADQLAQRGGDATAIPEILDRLGDPNDIAREAGAGYPAAGAPAAGYWGGGYPGGAPQQSKAQEIFAVILIAIGGFIGGIGWIVGVVLLWSSRRFSTADKLIGTLLIPGGLAVGLVLVFIGGIVPATVSVDSCNDSGPASLTYGRHLVRVSNVASDCVSQGTGTSVATVIFIVVGVVALIGPIYTTIRLSRRVAAM
jgi:hypothetical protein